MSAADQPLPVMDREEYLRWSAQRTGRYELLCGVPVAMAPERAGHNRLKQRAWTALSRAIAASGMACEAFGDGMTVAIDSDTIYEPDVSVNCGPPVEDDTIVLPNPVIVVEVVSPKSQYIDTATKLTDYFRVPGICHYLILRTDRKAVIHHRRTGPDMVETRIVQSGAISLDPPGLVVEMDALFPEPR